MSEQVEVHGSVSSGFERVEDAFRSVVGRGAADEGMSLAVDLRGELVVHLWSGSAAPGRPWSARTICPLWSVGKGLASIAVMLLADRGLVDPDGPVSEHWPAFAVRAKQDARVSSLLDHSVGLAYVEGYESVVTLDDAAAWLDLGAIEDMLAAAEPAWSPGTLHGYHAVTMGWLVAGLVRSVTGRSFGDFFRSELAEPHDLSLWAGVPAAEHDRVARLRTPSSWSSPALDKALNPATTAGQVMFVGHRLGLRGGVERTMNSPEFWRSETPGIGMVGEPRSLAKLYGLLALDAADDGRRVASRATIRRHTAERYHGEDVLLGGEMRVGLGFQLPSLSSPFSPSPRAFGHAGLSGTQAFADPDLGLGFSYVPNGMTGAIGLDARAKALIDATYDAVRTSVSSG